MLEVQGVKAAYSGVPALHGIDLSVAEGEFVGILGHNGMGKTTLLKTLIGVLKATDGSIRFEGRDITQVPPHQRNRLGIGYVAQGRAIFPKLSVLENLRAGLVMHAKNKAAAERTLEEVLESFPRLKPILTRSGGVLSGGEQQILALARALVAKPRLLMLDEPTEGIQPSIIDEIVEILQSLRARARLTIVLVEQNLDFIAELSQRVHVIQRGRITKELAPDQLASGEVIREFVGVPES